MLTQACTETKQNEQAKQSEKSEEMIPTLKKIISQEKK